MTAAGSFPTSQGTAPPRTSHDLPSGDPRRHTCRRRSVRRSRVFEVSVRVPRMLRGEEAAQGPGGAGEGVSKDSI